jgi:hypothetical protein
MKKTTLPVALVQERNHGSAEDNLAVIGQRVAEAAHQGAKLVLLQELHNGAYFCQHESVDEFDLAETIPGPSTERLAALARQHRVVLVSSLFEKRATGLYHNTAVVFDADGSTAGKYRKMHIPDDPGFYEKFYFTPGDGIVFQACDDPADSHHAELQAMAGEIAALRTRQGHPYRLFPLPWPQPIVDQGRRLAASYANFLVIDGAVLLPAYGDEADAAAAGVLAQAFPGREIVQVPCRPLIWQNGSLHCLTMQLPQGLV